MQKYLFLVLFAFSVGVQQVSAQKLTDYYTLSGPQVSVTIDPVHANGGVISGGIFYTKKLAISAYGVVIVDGKTVYDPYYAFQDTKGAITPYYVNNLQFRVNGGAFSSVAAKDEFIDGQGFVNGVAPAYQSGHGYTPLVLDIGGTTTNGVEVSFNVSDPDGITNNNSGNINLNLTGVEQITNTPEPSSSMLFGTLIVAGGIFLRSRRKGFKN